MGKKIKKAVKSVTKVVKKATVAGSAGLLGGSEKGGGDSGAAVVQAPAPAASVVEAPKEDADTTDEGDTEAAKKSARAKGKRGLSVARSAGTGVNI